jgi:hypothetical protein
MGTERRLATRTVFSAAFIIVLFALVPSALADKGGVPKGGGGGGKTSATTGGSVTSSSLSLISETVFNPSWAPSGCLTEDDYVHRVFSGSLYGSYATSYHLCDLSTDGMPAGGTGLESDVYAVGQLSDLTIASPDGSVHHAMLIGQTTAKGVTTSHYAVCYVPPYSLASDTSGTALQGGTWQITISGQLSSASWGTTATMTDVVFQQNYCPSSEQNLAP